MNEETQAAETAMRLAGYYWSEENTDFVIFYRTPRNAILGSVQRCGEDSITGWWQVVVDKVDKGMFTWSDGEVRFESQEAAKRAAEAIFAACLAAGISL